MRREAPPRAGRTELHRSLRLARRHPFADVSNPAQLIEQPFSHAALIADYNHQETRLVAKT